jgi:hypothetical protein
MNRGDEAISAKIGDCRASLATTKKEGLAITREVIVNATNLQSVTRLSELDQGDDRNRELTVANEGDSGGGQAAEQPPI